MTLPHATGELTFTVSELADAINAVLDGGFGGGVWVRGEIQGWSDRGKHAYFTLADDRADTPAVINVQFFAHARARLRRTLAEHRLVLGDGVGVRIFGTLDFWAPGGRLGFKMTDLDPRFTLGELALAREEVLARLKASGLFDANRALVLSRVPLRLGIVTSVGTAAWHDVRHVFERSGLGFALTVVDTRVQGEGAAAQVAGAIGLLGRRQDLDAIIVIRGGGARNELATFDDERIAQAILRAGAPVLTGLGHEIDRSVADEVAHTAHTTPTASAVFLVDRVRAALDGAEAAWAGITGLADRRLQVALGEVTDRAHRVARRTHAAVERADARLGARVVALARQVPRRLDVDARRLDQASAQLGRRSVQLLDAAARRIEVHEARIRGHDPEVLLARGWSITADAQGRVLHDASTLRPGDELRTRLARGALTSRVEQVHDHDHQEVPDGH